MAGKRLRIGFQFPAGRVHATPWGRHVNEGAVEWPPSPWRIGRALIATGFTKAGWARVPEVAAELLVRLASTPPIYYLPPATTSHTRHYMPTHKGTSKVIDAFVYPDRTGVLVVEWDVEVNRDELEVLDSLLGRMSYLGRAESWIEAQRVDQAPRGLLVCAPGDEPPGPAGVASLEWERVELLAMMPADDYAVWRERARAREADRRLERKRQRARDLGRRRPRSLSKILRARLQTELPAACIDALCVDTAELQRAGWSQPPGTRWLTYWRPAEALDAREQPHEHMAARMVASGLGGHDAGQQAYRAAVLELIAGGDKSPHLPPMRDALWRCDAVHKALVSLSASIDPEGRPAPCFTGRDERHAPLQGHLHTTLMPLAMNHRHGRGQRMDHIALYTPMGLDGYALAALQRLHVTYARDLPPLGVALVGVGQPEDLADRIPMFAASRTWESHTPFVPPRFLKASGKNSLVGQVCAELVARGLPEPVAVDVQVATAEGPRYLGGADFWPLWKRPPGRTHDGNSDGTSDGTSDGNSDGTIDGNDDGNGGDGVSLADAWRAYRRVRQGSAPKPPIDAAFGLRITFAEPVHGPISIGYASHFGLGLFVPA